MADIIALIHEDHDWFRRRFFNLDEARSEGELRAIWEALADRLDIHAQAEEEIFYPALLKKGEAGDPEDETDDAIRDHNKIRRAIRESRSHLVGSDEWYAAVAKAREENGEHLDEEEREALPDFIKSASLELRHDLAMRWLSFSYKHPTAEKISTAPRDPEKFIEQHS
jgi:hypothetical protein